MTIRQQGGVFGRNPTFNNVTIDGTLSGLSNLSLSGNLVLASGQGIDFSATSGAGTSELFDDYEEGTWTPNVQDNSGNSGSASAASAYYTKVGNIVVATIYLNNIDTTGLTSGDEFRIFGLPYVAAALDGIHFFTGDARMNSVTFLGSPSFSILDGSGYIRISQTISGSPSSFTAVSQIASGTADIYGSITYMSA